MKRFAIFLLSFGMLSNGCAVTPESDSTPVITDEATASNQAPLIGDALGGVAFVNWGGTVATGNVHNSVVGANPYQNLWVGSLAFNYWPLIAVKGPTIASGYGSFLMYQASFDGSSYSIQPATVAPGGTVSLPGATLGAQQHATHAAVVGSLDASYLTAPDTRNYVRVFFYDRNAGSGSIWNYSYDPPTGAWAGVATSLSWTTFGPWDVVDTARVQGAVSSDAAIFLYNRTTGAAAIGRFDLSCGAPNYYCFVSAGPAGKILDENAFPYTHAVYVPGQGVVFYTSTDGMDPHMKVVTAFNSNGSIASSRTIATPGTGWRNMIATGNGKAFFYNETTGKGQAVDLSLTYANASLIVSGFSTDWLTITRVE